MSLYIVAYKDGTIISCVPAMTCADMSKKDRIVALRTYCKSIGATSANLRVVENYALLAEWRGR